jgi:hypothetical protein
MLAQGATSDVEIDYRDPSSRACGNAVEIVGRVASKAVSDAEYVHAGNLLFYKLPEDVTPRAMIFIYERVAI